MVKPKLLIVGAFPLQRGDFKANSIFGGILKSSQIILNSSIARTYEIVPLDSSQKSNPPPVLIIRSLLAIKRVLILIYKLNFEKPKAALIFASDGLSAIEKGLMVWLCHLFNCPSLIFPRAGNLIDQLSNSPFMFHSIKYLYGKATVFLCQGSGWKDFVITEFSFNESKVKVINNWTATKKLISIGKEREYSYSRRIPKLLFVAWLEEFKGIFELLNVCKNLYDSDIKFHLTLAGSGRAEHLAKQFVEQHQLTSCITFLGWVDEKSLQDNLRDNDIFVLPSHSEGLPNAMIEAMAAGLAVTITSVGMIPDFVKDREHALLVSPRDEKSLELALKSLIFDTDLRKDIAINGHNLAKNSFSSETATKDLEVIIDKAISLYRS